MNLHETEGRLLDVTLDSNPSHQSNLGVFLNANQYQHVADFHQAWHTGTANTIIYFARFIKNRYSGKLVGAFYGSYGCTNFFDMSTAGATLRILNSGCVDFLASPGVYNNREPGGYVAQRQMQDSFYLRGLFFVAEEDSRTHLEDDFYRDGMRLYTISDSLNTLKRDFGRNLCEDTFAWWFDQHKHGGRYEHDEFYRLFSRQQEIAHVAYEGHRNKIHEIAIIYDQESIHYVSQYTSTYMLDFYRTSDLGRIGAPVDYYFHNDMSRADMPDYKLYLMVGIFCLDDDEREVIRKKAARNGAVLIWLYAPGFINPSQSPRMDNRNIEDIVGMKISRIDNTISPRFRIINDSHPALKYGDRDRLYGYIDRSIHSNIWLGAQQLAAPYLNPGFYINDPDADILGRYCINGLPALAMKEQPDGWTSVYCAPQILRSELIASFAAYAGCNLYGDNEDCIYANHHFITIHAAYTGAHTLYLPDECSPYEVYEKRYYGINVSKLNLDMHIGDTLMFYLNGTC